MIEDALVKVAVVLVEGFEAVQQPLPERSHCCGLESTGAASMHSSLQKYCSPWRKTSPLSGFWQYAQLRGLPFIK